MTVSVIELSRGQKRKARRAAILKGKAKRLPRKQREKVMVKVHRLESALPMEARA